MFKLHEFECDCGNLWEELVEGDTCPCQECGEVIYRSKLGGKLGKFSIRDAVGRRQELLRRSAAHSHSELKKNPEKFGELGIKMAREGQIRSVGGLKK